MGKFDDNKYVNTMTQKYNKVTKADEKSVIEKVTKALEGISKTDDFHVKVTHALKNGNISNGNLESSLQKIEEHKKTLTAE